MTKRLKIKRFEQAIYRDGGLHCITRKSKAKELVRLLGECFKGVYTIGNEEVEMKKQTDKEVLKTIPGRRIVEEMAKEKAEQKEVVK